TRSIAPALNSSRLMRPSWSVSILPNAMRLPAASGSDSSARAPAGGRPIKAIASNRRTGKIIALTPSLPEKFRISAGPGNACVRLPCAGRDSPFVAHNGPEELPALPAYSAHGPMDAHSDRFRQRRCEDDYDEEAGDVEEVIHDRRLLAERNTSNKFS